jgi:hypothetical protein
LLKFDIPLRSGSAPAQITIPDGGDDGRVVWIGGSNQIAWLPSRYSVFQCKKSTISPSSLKKETWTKSSRSDSQPEINEALATALDRSGAYIVVTATPVVGTNVDRRLDGVRDGISDTGHDPSQLTSMEIYDCNKLAAWSNIHPAVVLWVNSMLRDVHLIGFCQSQSKKGPHRAVKRGQGARSFRALGRVLPR